MAVLTPLTRPGQSNGAGDVDALFLEVAAGEVITAWEQAQVMRDLHMVRTISEGKTARFPIMGQGQAVYHQAGTNIMTDSNADSDAALREIKHAEALISIDDVLISSVFVPDIDEMKNHFDVRALYTTELGRQLAYSFDKATLRTVIAASRTANPLTERAAGGSVTDADFLTNGASAVETIFTLAQTMDEKYVPREDRHIVVSPGAYYNLARQTDLVNKDITSGGNGDFAKAVVMECAGIKIHKSVHFSDLIAQDESGGGGLSTAGFEGASANSVNNDVFAASGAGYGGDFTNTAAVCFHKSAIGTVKLMDLSMQQEYIIERQGTLMLARYAMGHGPLRNDAAFEVVIA